ncbi:hypothetical protein IGI46_002249 [Enterococcus sp. AZ163]
MAISLWKNGKQILVLLGHKNFDPYIDNRLCMDLDNCGGFKWKTKKKKD